MPRLQAHQIVDLLCQAALTPIRPRDLAKKLNIDRSAVYYHIKSAGVSLHSPGQRKLSSKQVEDLLRRYTFGDSYKDIASSLCIDEAAVYYHIKKSGVEQRGKTGRPPLYTGDETEYPCTVCKQIKPIDQFSPSSNSRTRRTTYSICKSCTIRRRACSTYGLTIAQYDLLHSRGQCDICGSAHAGHRGRSLFIDHDHTTGVIRGLLCEACNSGLSKCNDSIEPLLRYLAYLQTPLTAPPASKWEGGTKAEYDRYRNYGITPVQYRLVDNGSCHCCGELYTPTPRRPSLLVDHDHDSGVVRGLLCMQCNISLGKFSDSTSRIQAAIDYLTNPPGVADVT